MYLRAAILGLLSWKPASGYDLKRIISESEIFYWSGNNNQIYKTLLELQREGLVSHLVQLQESLPAKKIYSVTEKGISTLRQSLMTDPEAPAVQKNFLVQLAWAENLSDEEIMTLLKKYEEEITNRLGMLQGKAACPANCPDRSRREQFLWERITQNLIATYQTELDWVHQTLATFSAGKLSR